MNEVLTMDEIKLRFNEEWVLLEDPIEDKRGQTVGGKVLWHSKDRDEIEGKYRELRPKHGEVFYNGKGTEGMLYCL